MKKTTKKEVAGFCKRFGITEAQFYGKEKIEGNLSLYDNQLTVLPDGFNPTIGGNLYLYNNQLTVLPDGFNPTIGGNLYLHSNQLTVLPDGFNPTVGGNLSLYNNQLTVLPDGFNPTAGGDLYLYNNSMNRTNAQTKKPTTNIVTWCEKYIKVDGIFTEIVNKRGNTYRVKKINNDKLFWLVTDGKFTHAHGDTLKQAKEDFEFKLISEKLKHEPIKEDTIISIAYYHTVTGACNAGIKDWMGKVFNEKELSQVERNGIKAKDLFPLLKKHNAYGYEKFNKLVTFNK